MVYFLHADSTDKHATSRNYVGLFESVDRAKRALPKGSKWAVIFDKDSDRTIARYDGKVWHEQEKHE